MGLPLIWPGDADFLGCLGHHLRVVIVHSRRVGQKVSGLRRFQIYSQKEQQRPETWSQRGIKNSLK